MQLKTHWALRAPHIAVVTLLGQQKPKLWTPP
jgi:hypothetical protein